MVYTLKFCDNSVMIAELSCFLSSYDIVTQHLVTQGPEEKHAGQYARSSN